MKKYKLLKVWYKFVYCFNKFFVFPTKLCMIWWTIYIPILIMYGKYTFSNIIFLLFILFLILYSIPTFIYNKNEQRKNNYQNKIKSKYTKRIEKLDYVYLDIKPSWMKDKEIRNSIINLTPEMDSMTGYEFEIFCAHILAKNGFSNTNVTKGSGDQGVDIIAEKDGIKYAIQCKCYSGSVGNHSVQEAYAGSKFYDCHVPVVMTNSFFTKSAMELADKNNVLLWDRNKIIEFLINYRVG